MQIVYIKKSILKLDKCAFPLSETHFCVGFEMETVTLLSTFPSIWGWGQCLFSGPGRRAWDWAAPEEGAEDEDEEEEEEEEAEEVRSGR